MGVATTRSRQRLARRQPGTEASPLGEISSLRSGGGWLSIILLGLMLLSVAWSLNAAGWSSGLHVLQWMVIGGGLLGFAMSQSRWRGLFPVLHALVCSIAWLSIWMSTLLPGEFTARQRTYQLFAGVALWVQRVIAGTATAGGFMFVLVLALLTWWLAFTASWAIFRRQKVWAAIVPAGLLMLVNLYYAAVRLDIYYLLFTFCALMLAVRNNLAQREDSWRADKVRYAMDIGLDFLRDGLIFALVVLALSFYVPGAASKGQLEPLFRPLERPWQAFKAEWNRVFSSLQYPSQPGYNAFGRTLALSGPVALTDTVVMDIKAPDGRYWRAVAYHKYTGRGWINTDEYTTTFGRGERQRLPSYERTQEISQTITTYYPGNGVLFAAGQPVRSAIAAVAAVNYLPEHVVPTPTPEGGIARRFVVTPPLDISLLQSRNRLQEGDTYSVVSTISRADMESLRGAGDAYPDWIRDRYLQLPDDLPQRVRDKAFEITAPHESAYDKASALERYLREELPYNENIAPPPAGQDGVDYFLFEVQEGYCDYFSSAMATMARAVGIPARLAAGYSQGEFDEERQAYRVRELNAHAWVEVFFPNYGWVEFEPTANEPQIVRPVAPSDDLGDRNPMAPDSDGLDEDKFGEDPELGQGSVGGLTRGQSWWPLSLGWTIASAVAIGLVFAGLVAWLISRRRRSRAASILTDLYERMILWGQRLRVQWQAQQTVFEQAQAMGRAVPDGRDQIHSIASLYVRERFSPVPASQEEIESASRAWGALLPILWKTWVRLISRPPKRFVQWRERWSRRLASQFPG